MILTNKNAAT
ncbi:hypothetical protein YPPY32_2657, partial [Yersinia pestis PY-32]